MIGVIFAAGSFFWLNSAREWWEGSAGVDCAGTADAVPVISSLEAAPDLDWLKLCEQPRNLSVRDSSLSKVTISRLWLALTVSFIFGAAVRTHYLKDPGLVWKSNLLLVVVGLLGALSPDT